MSTKEKTGTVHTRRRRRRKRSLRMRCSLWGIWLGLLVSAGCFATYASGTDEVPMASLESAEPTEPMKPVEPAEPMKPVEPAEPPAALSTVSPDDWQLLLVNRWNPVPDGSAPTLTELKHGHAVDARAYPDLQEMLDACRAAGLEPTICSSYRTQEKQQELYENKIRRLLAEGLSYESAVAEAGTVVAVPGTSEHQTGLALDIVDTSYQHLDEAQENTQVQQWLMEHSWEYGFVLRYPDGKSEITGIIYEPWHYRYVGRAAAREMTELGLCLEEYVDWLRAQ